jgi:hypothetical protein
MTRIYAMEACGKMDLHLKECAAAVAEGDDLRILLTGFRRFMKYVPANLKELRRKVAAGLIKAGKYQL